MGLFVLAKKARQDNIFKRREEFFRKYKRTLFDHSDFPTMRQTKKIVNKLKCVK